MNAKNAERLFRCHRDGPRAGEDARIRRAVLFAENDPALKAKLDEQLVFDARMAAIIGGISAPPDVLERLRDLETPAERPLDVRAMLKTPPAIAIGIALLVFAVLGVYFGLNRMDDFPGKEDAVRMIDENTGGDDTVAMQPKSARAGDIEDWLFSMGLEGYYVPAEIADWRIAGGRVFKQDGLPVAQIALERNSMLAYVFRADDFGVKLKPPNQWRIFLDDDWVAAIQTNGGMCFMLTFRGSKADMQSALGLGAK